MSISIENQVFCILGMHRSGTSCLMGSLEEAGVFLGNVSRKNPHNIRGNHELIEIVQLHEHILEANNCAWDRPTTEITWYDEHRLERDRIISSFQGAQRWGFKDPRTVMTLPGWLEIIPEIKVIAIFRHPLLVANSLAKRNGFTKEKGLNLWLWYNKQIIRFHESMAFPIISFDAPEQLLKVNLRGLFRLFNLSVKGEELTFFDELLRTSHVLGSDDSLLPSEVATVYQRLKSLAQDWEQIRK